MVLKMKERLTKESVLRIFNFLAHPLIPPVNNKNTRVVRKRKKTFVVDLKANTRQRQMTGSETKSVILRVWDEKRLLNLSKRLISLTKSLCVHWFQNGYSILLHNRTLKCLLVTLQLQVKSQSNNLTILHSDFKSNGRKQNFLSVDGQLLSSLYFSFSVLVYNLVTIGCVRDDLKKGYSLGWVAKRVIS